MIRVHHAAIAVLLVGVACGRSAEPAAAPTSAPAASPRLLPLAWIVGDWEGRSAEGGDMDEHWISVRGDSILGVSREIAAGKMTFFELIRIEDRGDAIYLVPQPRGKPGHDFKLTSLVGQRAVFEHTGDDRIKRIVYVREGDRLSISIAGAEDGKPIAEEFRFHAVQRR